MRLNTISIALCILNATRHISAAIPSSITIAIGVEKLPIITSRDTNGRLHTANTPSSSARMPYCRMSCKSALPKCRSVCPSRLKCDASKRSMDAENSSVIRCSARHMNTEGGMQNTITTQLIAMPKTLWLSPTARAISGAEFSANVPTLIVTTITPQLAMITRPCLRTCRPNSLFSKPNTARIEMSARERLPTNRCARRGERRSMNAPALPDDRAIHG